MTGSKLQLYSVGKENSYLTKNPQFSVFKTVYSMHSNFAMQVINLNFEGKFNNLSLDNPTKLKLTLKKNASLIHKLFLKMNLPTIQSPNLDWAPNIGEILVKEARIRIGGQIIEEYDSEYMHIYNRLSSNYEKNNFLDSMMNCSNPPSKSEMDLYIPLPFWFHRDIGSSLPIYNFTSHDVIIEIELRPLKELCIFNDNTELSLENINNSFLNNVWNINPSLYTTYIFLDKSEELRFKTSILSYLVEPIKKIIINPTNLKNTFNISDEIPRFPSKEFIIFGKQKESITNDNSFLDFSNKKTIPKLGNIISKIGIQFDQTKRVDKKDSDYFNTIQPYMHHKSRLDYIYSYSFSLFPDKFQPSGTCNLTHIPEVFIEIDLEDKLITTEDIINYNIYLYIRHYNILNINSGLGNLLLSSK